MAIHFSLLIALTIIINLHLISSHPIPPPPPPPPHQFSPPPPPHHSIPPPSPPPHHSSPPPPPPHSTTTPSPRITATPPPPHAPPTTPPPPHQPSPIEQDSLDTIIDSLTSQPGFQIWANLLSSSTKSNLLPITATLFIPSNTAISHFPTATSAAINFDPFLIPYHITPTRLSFSDLHLFQPFSRIPTLLPSKSILVTNTSSHNFTLDNSRITRPDMYLSSAIAVHGVQHILDYALFGNDESPPQPRKKPFLPLDEVLGQIKSDDSHTCLCPVFPLFCSLVLAAVFLFKIL